MSSEMRIKVWDLPVRLFHWALAAAVAGAVVTANQGMMEWHERCGFAAASLVVFRVIWGVVGSETARFSQFVRGPGTVRAYLRGQWRGIGHNPLGALSVLALLAAVLVQAGTGIFSNDDILFSGPWAYAVGERMSGQVTGWHLRLRWVVIGLVALHLAAVAVHVFVKRERIIEAMIHGRAEGDRAPRMRHPLWALPVLALAVFLTGIAFRYWIA